MKSYSFSTKNPGDFDFDRVLAENPDSDVIVIVGPVDVAVLMRAELCAQFCYSEKILVKKEALYELWGFEVQRLGFNRDLAFHSFDGPDRGWRWRSCPKKALASVLAEVAAARKYLAERRFKFKVLLP